MTGISFSKKIVMKIAASLTMVKPEHPLHVLLWRHILLGLQEPIDCCDTSSDLETLIAVYQREDPPVEIVPEGIQCVVLGMVFAVGSHLKHVLDRIA